MALLESKITLSYKDGHGIDFHNTVSIVTNLDEFGTSVSAAMVNLLARIDQSEVTVWQICEYITSKDPVNIICIPFEQWSAITERLLEEHHSRNRKA